MDLDGGRLADHVLLWIDGDADVGLVHHETILYLLTGDHDELLQIIVVSDLLQHLHQDVLLSGRAVMHKSDIIQHILLLLMNIFQLNLYFFSLFNVVLVCRVVFVVEWIVN